MGATERLGAGPWLDWPKSAVEAKKQRAEARAAKHAFAPRLMVLGFLSNNIGMGIFHLP